MAIRHQVGGNAAVPRQDEGAPAHCRLGSQSIIVG
jgi:hypothetical protein